MSSFRSANGGASKPRVHNVNSVYSGKNTAASKASGPSKHGLQSLGKATAVVRRMPPPATLPSLKAEHGQDPTIPIVPQGGTGWTRSLEDFSSKPNGSPSTDNVNAPDLRPTWAKSATGSSIEHQTNISNPTNQVQGTTAQVVAGQVPSNNRDFPSLASSVAVGKDSSTIKPQKTNAWGTNLEDVAVEIPAIPTVLKQSSGYIGASTAPKPDVERKLPERYFSSMTTATTTRTTKVDIREKLAKISMENKEIVAEPELQQQEKEASPVANPSVPVVQQQTPPNIFSQPPPIQNPPRSSQDVRQIHGPPPQFDQSPTQEWNSECYYEYDRHHLPPNGRGDGGYSRHYQGPGYPQRYEEPSRQQYRQELGQGDDHGWKSDDIRGTMPPNHGMRLQHGNRYRMDSRSSNEAENNWQGNYPRQTRGPPQQQVWYDNGNQMGQHDYHANQYHQNYRGQDFRRFQHNQECEFGNYNENVNNFDQQHDRSSYRGPPQQQRQQQQEMPYRMLKRNDEKSAEYIAHHGGAVVPQNKQEQLENLHQNSKKPKEQKTKQTQRSSQKNEEPISQEVPSKTTPPENVWEKRIEERKKEEKTNHRYQQELDSHFPSIDQQQEPSNNEWGSEPFGNSGQRRSQKKSNKAKSDVDTEVIGSTHWVQEQTGPSWDNLTIPTDHRTNDVESDDDVYTGTKREFYNSKRSRGAMSGFKSESSRGSSRSGKSGLPVRPINGRKPNVKYEGKKRPEDNFSNMGEFHVDDFKSSEETNKPRNRKDSDLRNYDNGFDDSRRGNKRSGQKPIKSWKNETDFSEQESGENDYHKKLVNGNSRGTGRFTSRSNKPLRPRGEEKKSTRPTTERSTEGVKSPVISEGIDDEWETASESSDFAERIREEKNQKVEKKTSLNSSKIQTKPRTNGTSEDDRLVESSKPVRTGSKNVKPASHTFPGNNASVKNNGVYNKSNNDNSSQLLPSNKRDAKAGLPINARDSRKNSVRKDGLAGVDINDASVIIIDNQPDVQNIEEWVSGPGDFEEVLSKKQKKQKQLQIEEEKLKEIWEKEKVEKKKKINLSKKIDKNIEKKSQEKTSDGENISVAVDETDTFQNLNSSITPDLGTSVWNSVRIQSSQNVIEEKQTPHIPSPIARPIKPQTSNFNNSMTVDVSVVKDEYASYGIPPTVATSASVALYELQTFDPKTSPIGTKPVKTVQSKDEENVLSSDHAVLKEKLDKVKDFWQGEVNTMNSEKITTVSNLSQAHGPNVAKVKPQPQLSDQQQSENKMKTTMDTCNIFAIPQAQSPNLYHQNPVFPLGQTSQFTAMASVQNPNYPIMYGGGNEFMQGYGHQNSPPAHSMFRGQLGLITPPNASTCPQPSYDAAVFGSMWSNGMDFFNGMNPTPPISSQNRYSQQYGSNSRPNSANVLPTNIPPPPINFNQPQQRQMNNFVPTHMHPPPQPFPQMGEFLSGPPPPPPIGTNRGNGSRFSTPPNSQSPSNLRQSTSGNRQQFGGFSPQNRTSNQKNNAGNYQNNSQSQRSSPNWQKNNQQPQQSNYGGYFNVRPTA